MISQGLQNPQTFLPVAAHDTSTGVVHYGLRPAQRNQETGTSRRSAALGGYQLIQRGHQVIVQRGAGVDSGYPDDNYEPAGAKLVNEAKQVFAEADLIRVE